MVLTTYLALEIKEKMGGGKSREDAMMPKAKKEGKRRLKKHEGGEKEESRKIGRGVGKPSGAKIHPKSLCQFRF